MIKVYKIRPLGFASNTFAVTADGKSCVLIDCAQPRVLDECKKLQLTPEYVLLTHGHFDHIGGCGALFGAGAQVLCSEEERGLIFSDNNLASAHGLTVDGFRISRTLTDGEKVSLCGMDFTVVATPGHTAGGVCYAVEDCLFTGDTLFCESVGRCDLPTGNARQLVDSVKKLYALDGDYRVYCGHEDDTTLDHERKYNPYVRQSC